MIQQDIREHLSTFNSNIVFSYGRSFDTALAAAKIEIDEWFVHLDPVTFEGVANNTESAKIAIGFLKQDKPDSEFDTEQNIDISDSIETIQNDAKELALLWLNNFLDNYHYSDSSYTITPATRVKNVMSGVLLNLTFNYKPTC